MEQDSYVLLPYFGELTWIFKAFFRARIEASNKHSKSEFMRKWDIDDVISRKLLQEFVVILHVNL